MKKKSVLVVAAHPDDEALGCGGTIARHANEGDTVYAIFLTDGVSSRGREVNNVAVKNRRIACEKAAKVLGVSRSEFFNYPDNMLDDVPLLDLAKTIEAIVERVVPDVVYTHSPADLNIDHRIACEATLVACRPQPKETDSPRILFYEILSSTEWGASHGLGFHPNWFVGIESYLDHKRKALEIYSQEMRNFPHPRSMRAVTALSDIRGSACGLSAAEGFILHREIVN